MLDQLPASLPALTAIATLIAAGIGAVVAITVAALNAWSARRIAIDTAHRQFRQDLADSAVAATRSLLEQVRMLDRFDRYKDEDGWRKLVASMDRGGDWVKADLRTPHDPVFAAALKLFKVRRGHFHIWLSIKGRNQLPGFGMTEAAKYISEAAEIVQVAAEAYVFNIRGPRKRAKALLDSADPLPLKKRIDARLKVYEDAFGPDDGSLIDLDARPEEEEPIT